MSYDYTYGGYGYGRGDSDKGHHQRYDEDDDHQDGGGYDQKKPSDGLDVFYRTATEITKLLPSIFNLKVVSE